MKQRLFKRAFETQYFFWGHSVLRRADAKGFSDDLTEAYGNASRQLGRGSVYYKAVIIDREQGRVIAVLTRSQGQISIKEL